MPLRKLPTFKGYTVDVRLREFRKFELDQMGEIIDFDSDQGRELIEELQKEGFTTPMMEYRNGKFVPIDE
jgi:hypothetical protein